MNESTLRLLLPESVNTFRIAMTRHVRTGALLRIAPGLYLNPFCPRPPRVLERLALRRRIQEEDEA